MPAVVRCPNGCKLQVPARKIFSPISCPKCQATIFIANDDIRRFQADMKLVLDAHLSEDLMEVLGDDDVTYLGGSSQTSNDDQLVDITDDPEYQSGPPAVPPPAIQPPAIHPPAIQATSASTNQNTLEEFAEPNSIPSVAGPNQTIDLTSPNSAVAQAASERTIEDEEAEVHRLEEKLSAEKQRRSTLWDRLAQRFHHPDNPGVSHRKDERWNAYSLAWGLIAIGVLMLGPVIYTMTNWIGKDYYLPLGRWSYVLIFFAAIQFLYALFLSQIPDWTTTRFVSFFMLFMTVIATFLLSIAFLSGSESSLFQMLGLSIMEKSKVCSWLLVMTLAFAMMSYLCGRTSQLWMQEESRRAIFS